MVKIVSSLFVFEYIFKFNSEISNLWVEISIVVVNILYVYTYICIYAACTYPGGRHKHELSRSRRSHDAAISIYITDCNEWRQRGLWAVIEAVKLFLVHWRWLTRERQICIIGGDFAFSITRSKLMNRTVVLLQLPSFLRNLSNKLNTYIPITI